MRSRRTAGDDIDTFFDNDVHLPSRTLYCGNSVSDKGTEAEFFLKGLSLLLSSNAEDPITIILNNAGGDEYHGLAIYDAIASAPCKITIKAFGHVMSMGSWIFQAADRRIMAPRATMLLHYGSWSADIEAPSRGRLESFVNEGKRLNDLMEDTYLHRIQHVQPDFSRTRLQRMLLNEAFITAEEAVELGLCDEVLT